MKPISPENTLASGIRLDGISPLSESAPTRWSVFVDGTRAHVHSVLITNANGTLAVAYGDRKDGDGPLILENGGGGSITVPYAVEPKSNEIYVGGIREKRPNMGSEPVLCAIGGILERGETHGQGEARERAEETGLGGKATEASSLPFNYNRLLHSADATRNEGVHTYLMPCDWSEIREEGGRLVHASMQPKKLPIEFHPWQDIARLSPDVMLRSGVLDVITAMRERMEKCLPTQ